MANEPDGTLQQAGWATYAAIMLFGGGLVGIVNGIWALRYDDTRENLVVLERDLVLWGSVSLIGGAVMLAIGIGVFYGAAWSRWAGIAIAVFSLMWNVGWAEIQPIQSLIGALIAASVIYALATNPVTVERP